MSRRDRQRPRSGSKEIHARHRRRGTAGTVVVHTGHSGHRRYRGETTLDVLPDRRVRRVHHPVDPVFVDGSGRRRRAFRRFVLLTSLVLVCLGLFLAAAMLNSREPAPPLPATAGTNP